MPRRSTEPRSMSAAASEEPTAEAATRPAVRELLAAAVGAVGGSERPGQVADGRGGRRRDGRPASTCSCRPAPAPASRWPTWCRRCCTTSAGGRLHGHPGAAVPARRPRPAPARRRGRRRCSGRRPTFAVLKGRTNYVCLPLRRRRCPTTTATRCSTRADDGAGPGRRCGCASWAEETDTGDRDELDPGVDDRAWRQVASPPASASGARSARSARSASPRRRGTGRARPTSWSPTTPARVRHAGERAGAARARRCGRRRGARAGRPGDRRRRPPS